MWIRGEMSIMPFTFLLIFSSYFLLSIFFYFFLLILFSYLPFFLPYLHRKPIVALGHVQPTDGRLFAESILAYRQMYKQLIQPTDREHVCKLFNALYGG
jgi:hypothetical protein